MPTHKDNAISTIPFEHERKFIPDLKNLPFDYTKYPMKLIRQGYLEDEGKTRVRDEAIDGHHTYLQTRKTGHGVSRTEDEEEISKDEFDAMWKNVKYSLNKTRYIIPWDDIEIEFNVFHGALRGYVQIEIEFVSHEKAVGFNPASWLGKEVTDEESHQNYTLAKLGLPQ